MFHGDASKPLDRLLPMIEGRQSPNRAPASQCGSASLARFEGHLAVSRKAGVRRDRTEREVALEAQATAPAADRSDPLMRQASVLVVDDEPGMRNFLVKTLQPHCRAVLEAADVGIASAMLQQQRFDIVLLDNRMPGPRGIDWLMQQRKQGCGSRPS
ncbi:response regulator [Paracoccus sp. DMF]|uniref:response regulator n=1 Tax=Paracoccus sp. DMF TaxID=400837 RepID=UPI00296232EB|nr:response regulator [Paracoccus sp. DMF]